MNVCDKFITQVLEGFQCNKGKASVYCFAKDIIPKLVSEIIKRFRNKHPTASIFIAVDSYDTRIKILNKLYEEELIDRQDSFVRILSSDYIKTKYKYSYYLNILVGINDDERKIVKLANDSNFTMCILTENIMNNYFINSVRKVLPAITTNITSDEIIAESIYSPVEEHRVGIVITDDDKEKYNAATEYINTSVSILGSIDNIDKCKNGDIKSNISAIEFRHQLAIENGWNENLDITIEFQKQIDDIYNPNAILERACNFYSITKTRRDLVTDNESKLAEILRICEENADKKILIISKRGEYAATITEYINKHNSLGKDICGDYHDCIKDAIATNEYGEPILVKSGINKGKARILGHQAQSSLNEKLFNNNIINILSSKDSINSKLKTAVDLIIFTSSFCKSIIDLRKRLTNVKFNGVPIICYKLYCFGTIENKIINNSVVEKNIKVINDTENSMEYDENNGDIVLQYE